MSPDVQSLSGLQLLRLAAQAPSDRRGIGGLLGIQIDSVGDGEVAFSLDTRPNFANPLGTVHGGICATLLDSVTGCAVHTKLGPGIGYGTLEWKINYSRTVPTDNVHLRAIGRTVNRIPHSLTPIGYHDGHIPRPQAGSASLARMRAAKPAQANARTRASGGRLMNRD